MPSGTRLPQAGPIWTSLWKRPLGVDGRWDLELTGQPGFRRMKAHGPASNPQRRVQAAGVRRSISAARRFTGYPSATTLSSVNWIPIWVEKHQGGALDEGMPPQPIFSEVSTRPASPPSPERGWLVGRPFFVNLKLLRGLCKARPRPRNGPTSAIAGPPALVAPGCRLMGMPARRSYPRRSSAPDDTASSRRWQDLRRVRILWWRRVRAELRHSGCTSTTRVRRLMREHDLQPRRRRRYVARPPTAITISRSIPIRPKTCSLTVRTSFG